MNRSNGTSSKRGVLAHHEYADLFPLLHGEELKAFAADININGLQVPITLYEGKILDGRNRYRACQMAKVKPRFERFKGTDAEALALVVSLNVARRHLNTPQKAALSVSLFKIEKKLALDRKSPKKRHLQNFAGASRDLAGKKIGISGETVRQAAKIAEESPDVLEAMASGVLTSMPDALLLASLPKPRRTRILRRMKDEGTGIVPDGGHRTLGFSYLRPTQETNEWHTPEIVLEAARAVMGGIELDPASCPQANRRVKAKRIFTVREDGLTKPWKAKSLFLNPPFGLVDNESYVGLWVKKLISEHEAGRTQQAILIVMATVSHRWFRPLWSFPMCLTYTRIKFVPARPEGKGGRFSLGSAIIYLGSQVELFTREFQHLGRIIIPDGEVSRVRTAPLR